MSADGKAVTVLTVNAEGQECAKCGDVGESLLVCSVCNSPDQRFPCRFVAQFNVDAAVTSTGSDWLHAVSHNSYHTIGLD